MWACWAFFPLFFNSSSRDANQQLQDTNDGLRSVVDIGTINSPGMGRHEFSTLLAPDIIRTPSDNEIADKLYHPLKRKKKR